MVRFPSFYCLNTLVAYFAGQFFKLFSRKKSVPPSLCSGFQSPSTQLELDNLLKTIAQRTVKLLEKRGFIVRDQTEGDKFLNITEAETMDQIHASSITYRIAFGKYKEQKALTLRAQVVYKLKTAYRNGTFKSAQSVEDKSKSSLLF